MLLAPKFYWPQLIPLFVLVVVALMFVAAAFMPVQAAKEAPPTVTACLMVATTNSLQISRCQDVDRGIIFYVNQLGWMMPDPY